MNKNIPRPGAIEPTKEEPTQEDNRGNPVEHLQMGVSLFMAQQEDKVRRKNAEIEQLKIERSNAWRDFICKNLESVQKNHQIDVREAWKTGICVGIVIGAGVSVLLTWGVIYYVRHF